MNTDCELPPADLASFKAWERKLRTGPAQPEWMDALEAAEAYVVRLNKWFGYAALPGEWQALALVQRLREAAWRIEHSIDGGATQDEAEAFDKALTFLSEFSGYFRKGTWLSGAWSFIELGEETDGWVWLGGRIARKFEELEDMIKRAQNILRGAEWERALEDAVGYRRRLNAEIPTSAVRWLRQALAALKIAHPDDEWDRIAAEVRVGFDSLELDWMVTVCKRIETTGYELSDHHEMKIVRAYGPRQAFEKFGLQDFPAGVWFNEEGGTSARWKEEEGFWGARRRISRITITASAKPVSPEEAVSLKRGMKPWKTRKRIPL